MENQGKNTPSVRMSWWMAWCFGSYGIFPSQDYQRKIFSLVLVVGWLLDFRYSYFTYFVCVIAISS